MPRGVRAIEVRYDFTPHDSGLGFSTNVVDIGIFDPSGTGLGNAAGFRGWSGGARRHVRLSRHWATPGYLAGPITPGRWHVTLGPFLITRPVRRSRSRHAGPRQPGPAGVRSPPRTRRGGRAPARAGTAATCTSTPSTPTAAGRPAQLVAQARANGLDFIGTSEHNTNSATRVFGPRRARRLPGHQRRGGDHPQRALARHRYDARHLDRLALPGGRPAARALHRPHPQPRAASRSRRTRTSRSPAPAGTSVRRRRLDAVEVWNGPWSVFNQLTVNAWQQQLVAGGFMPAVGNSDSHHDGQLVGLPQTVYRLDTLSSAAIVARGPRRALLDRGVVGRRPRPSPRPARAPPRPSADRATRWPSPPASSCRAASRDRRTGHARAADRQQRRAGLGRGGQRRRDHAPGRRRRAEGFVRAEVRRGTRRRPDDVPVTLPMVALTNPVFVTA